MHIITNNKHCIKNNKYYQETFNSANFQSIER